MNYRLLFVPFLFFSVIASAQRTFEITDPRDNQVYSAIEFEIPLEGGVSVTRSWLTQNSNYEVEGSYCYKDEPAYCDKFGRLYSYEGATQACPEGWRVPTREDWLLLFSLFNGITNAGTLLMEGGESGMNIMLAGFGYSPEYYNRVGVEGNYWDSTEKGTTPDGIMTFIRGDKRVHYDDAGTNKKLNSVRCIKVHR